MMKAKCSLCCNVVYARGLCRKHWHLETGTVPWHKANPEKQSARMKKWRTENPDAVKVYREYGHSRYKEQRNAYSRFYRSNNIEHMRELGRAWSKRNLDKARSTNASRRAKKNSATPDWARSEIDSFVTKEMFNLASLRTKKTGMVWHVDHIVPLKSKIVCGLHCSANLQVIPALINQSKGNRIWPDMP
jgi:hypothetical protein